MRKITLVCSVHRENGRCNAEELLRILRAIGPDVVFEEVRPSDFDAYYKTKWSLEAQAITSYRKSGSLLQAPIDQYKDNEATVELHALMGRVFDVVEQTSQTYLDLKMGRHELAHELGFLYLNSIAFQKTTEEIDALEDQTIRSTGNPDLIRALHWWREFHKRREMGMIGGIYEYCRDHAFDTGVFLVGAAHKASIVNAIRGRDGADAAMIDWTFTYADSN